jgi:hypothetical protein
VKIIENWAELTGAVHQVTESKQIPRFHEVKVHVERIDDVLGFPNLLQDLLGKTVTILIPSDLVSSLNITEEGSVLTGRVRKAARQRIYIHRDHIRIDQLTV